MSEDQRDSNRGGGNEGWAPYVPPRQVVKPEGNGPAEQSPRLGQPTVPAQTPRQARNPQSVLPPASSGVPRRYNFPAAGSMPPQVQARMQTPVQSSSVSPYAIQRQVRLEQPAPRRRRRRGGIALLVTLCLFFAIASGFVGGYVANFMRQAFYDAISPSISQPTDYIKTSDVTPYTEPTAPIPEVVTPAILTNTATRPLLSVPEVAAAVRQSVVEIKTETITNAGWRGNYVAEGAGSGVIISADGYIVTNNHVISGAESITVRLSDGREYSAALIGTDAKTDIAIIKISASGLAAAVFGDSAKLVVGETAIAVGNPLGELGGTVTCGIISALDRDIVIDGEIMSLLQTDAAVNPGNSGGGLFNLYGELIGVVNAKSAGLNIEGLGFAVPSNTAKAVISDLSEYGYVRGRIDDGLELVDIQTTQAARMYRVNQAGLYIYNSNDERLQSGDRIIGVDGDLVTCMSDYDEAMKGRAVGDVVNVTVSRGNQTYTFDITLKEWKPSVAN